MRRVVEAAPDLGIGTLTLFAFSSDNWRRPPLEVEVLMLLLRQYLRRDVQRLVENGVRLKVIGRRDRLPEGLAARDRDRRSTRPRSARGSISTSRSTTRRATRSRMRRPPGSATTRPARAVFGRLLAWQGHGTGRDVDLLIRTGGEKRLSDFLLWEMRLRGAPASSTRCGPTSAPSTCAPRSRDFRTRERRFGGLLRRGGMISPRGDSMTDTTQRSVRRPPPEPVQPAPLPPPPCPTSPRSRFTRSR